MNGLGDLRLALCRQELLSDGPPQVVGARPRAGEPEASRWRLFWRRLSTRRALLYLDDAQLQDVGLTRAQAQREALRPFWTL